ncbi:hypothetical protein MBANPS3_004475 [Mucor bainieri]
MNRRSTRECAMDSSSESKTVKDEGKLTQKAKDSWDKILCVAPEQVDTKIWTVQTLGPLCSISMLDIFDVGLYVANFKYAFSIPHTITSFVENIAAILKILFTMRRDVVRLANSIVASEESPTDSHQSSFNRQRQSNQPNPRLGFTRDTYYTPPKGAASKLPHHYYGPPPPSILPKLQALSGQDSVAHPVDSDDHVRLEDGLFYNKFTKKITETHQMISTIKE